MHRDFESLRVWAGEAHGIQRASINHDLNGARRGPSRCTVHS